jgi:hypothetical protein
LLDIVSDRTDLQSPGAQDGKGLKSSPFRGDGEPLLFPFLVLEAKSEKGEDGFGSIEMQTALSIRTLVKLQADLQLAAGEQSTSLGVPLVWFFATKGEHWRVSAAYTTNREQAPQYVRVLSSDVSALLTDLQHVIDLWSGHITGKDDALRLVLIIDYIFDWARDLYRPTVFRYLKTLAARDSASLAEDSDIFSMVDPVSSWLNRDVSEEDPVLELRNECDTGIPQSLLAIDCEYGVVRHASFIQSLLLGLCITAENLESLLLSFPTPDKAQKYAREILQAMKQSWCATAETLNALEAKWTGNYREREEPYDPQAMFYVIFGLTAYMSQWWDQVRELSYVAVSEGAISLLLAHANFVQAVDIHRRHDYPVVDTEDLENFCDRVQTASVEDNLRATISSASIVGRADEGRKPSRPEWTLKIGGLATETGLTVDANGRTHRYLTIKSDPAVFFEADPNGQTRRIVSAIYLSHKIGRKEPSEPFLRISKRYDKQIPEPSSSFVWLTSKYLPVLGNGVLLSDISSGTLKTNVPRWCFYVINEPPEAVDAGSVLEILQKVSSERPRHYISCQRAKLEPSRQRYNYAIDKSEDEWHYQEGFERWLAHLRDLAEGTTFAKTSVLASPLETPEGVSEAFGPAAPPVEKAQMVKTKDESASPTGLESHVPEPLTSRAQHARDFSVAATSAQDTALRKRPSDSSDTGEDVELQPSKRHKTVFDSDYLTDEALQLLLDSQQFELALGRTDRSDSQ